MSSGAQKISGPTVKISLPGHSSVRKIWAPTLSRRAGPTEVKNNCPSHFLAATDPETPPVPQSSFSQLAQCYEDANSMPISLSPKQIGLSSSRSCLPSQSLAPIWWHLKETGLGQGTPRHATRRTSAALENSDAGAKNIAQRHGGVGAGHAEDVGGAGEVGDGAGEHRRIAMGISTTCILPQYFYY